MALRRAVADAVARRWAERLGCAPAAVSTPGVTLADATGPRTVRVLRRRPEGDTPRAPATVVAAPERLREALTAASDGLRERPLGDAAAWVREVLDIPTADVDAHGPFVLAYADRRAFAPAEMRDARLLTAADESAFAGLRQRVSAAEWARASLRFRPGRTAGLFRDGALVAAATLGDEPAHDVGVVVSPGHRDAGNGRAVVSRLLRAAFERDPGTLVRYRTPASAAASCALATGLGFEQWASEAVVVLPAAGTR